MQNNKFLLDGETLEPETRRRVSDHLRENHTYPGAAFLPLAAIRSHLPEMDRRGVSTVCRGPGGFLEAYRDAEGNPERLPPWWHARRVAFVARMHGQAMLRGEPPRDDLGRLTRRSLSLIAWAFDPELPGERRVLANWFETRPVKP